MKRISFILLAVLSLAACSTENNNLAIQGKVQGLKKGTLYLQKVEDSSLITIDSVVVSGSDVFSFKTNLESPQIMYLYLQKTDNSTYDDRIMFFAEPGEMSINTTLKNFEGDVVIEGSKNQDKFVEYQSMMQQFNTRNLELIQQNLMAKKDNDSTSIDASEREYESLLKRRYLYTVNFAITNKDMELAPYLAVSEVYDANIKYLDTIYNSLTPEVRDSKYGLNLKDYLQDRREMEKSEVDTSDQG